MSISLKIQSKSFNCIPFHASLLKWSRHPILYELFNEASIIDRGAPGRDRKKREFDLVFMIIVWEPLNTSIMITLILPSFMHSSSGTISEFEISYNRKAWNSTLKKRSSCARQPMPKLLTSNWRSSCRHICQTGHLPLRKEKIYKHEKSVQSVQNCLFLLLNMQMCDVRVAVVLMIA